jgi:hypothetical protein
LLVISHPGTKADCSSEITPSRTSLSQLAITFEQILYKTLHKEIGLSCVNSCAFYLGDGDENENGVVDNYRHISSIEEPDHRLANILPQQIPVPLIKTSCSEAVRSQRPAWFHHKECCPDFIICEERIQDIILLISDFSWNESSHFLWLDHILSREKLIIELNNQAFKLALICANRTILAFDNCNFICPRTLSYFSLKKTGVPVTSLQPVDPITLFFHFLFS